MILRCGRINSARKICRSLFTDGASEASGILMAIGVKGVRVAEEYA